MTALDRSVLAPVLVWLVSMLYAVSAKHLQFEWFATGNGFHRELHMQVTGPASILNTTGPCSMCIMLTVPQGMYIDKHQVAALGEFDGPEIHMKEMDVEKPEDQSTEHTVYVYEELGVMQDYLHSVLRFPVHLRYHKPSFFSDSKNVSLSKPVVLIRCEDNAMKSLRSQQAPCSPGSSDCSWRLPAVSFDSDKLTFMLPVGKMQHANLVFWGTVIATSSACVIAIYMIIRAKSASQRGYKEQKSK